MVDNSTYPVTSAIHIILYSMCSRNYSLINIATTMKNKIEVSILKEIISMYNKEELYTPLLLNEKQSKTCLFYINKYLGNNADEFISILSSLCS